MIVLLHQIIYSNVIQSTTMPHNYRIKTNIMVCFKKLNVCVPDSESGFYWAA